MSTISRHVKQDFDMPQIQNCVTRYSSPYWCSVPNIRKLACVVPVKKVTDIFCDADDDDDARRQKWSLYVAFAKAGRRHNNKHGDALRLQYFTVLIWLSVREYVADTDGEVRQYVRMWSLTVDGSLSCHIFCNAIRSFDISLIKRSFQFSSHLNVKKARSTKDLFLSKSPLIFIIVLSM